MAIVTLTERIMMSKGVKNDAVHFHFRWQQAQRFKNTVGPAPALHKLLRQTM